MEIIYSSKFAREYKKLPKDIKSLAGEQEKEIEYITKRTKHQKSTNVVKKSVDL